ncbi:MAG: hypothetical protein JXX28_10400 [Deltaproteobacteria bacterium]|nr:hypothetical protein [Deltaproteobacteria bacterium]
MQKTWIGVAAAAVLGVLIAGAAFSLSSPDTGGELAARPKQIPHLKGADIPPAQQEDWHPDQVARRLAEQAEAEGGAPAPGLVNGRSSVQNGGNPVSAGVEEARQAPEVRAVGMKTASWTEVRRLLMQHQDDQDAAELVPAINQLTRDMFDGRREPWNLDYADIERREAELAARLRDRYPNDPSIAKALARIDEVQSQYSSGALAQ